MIAPSLTNRDDMRNANHRDDLRKRIELDGIGCIHQGEYMLNNELISRKRPISPARRCRKEAKNNE